MSISKNAGNNSLGSTSTMKKSRADCIYRLLVQQLYLKKISRTNGTNEVKAEAMNSHASFKILMSYGRLAEHET